MITNSKRDIKMFRVNLIVESEGRYYPFTILCDNNDEILLAIQNLIEDIRETFTAKWCIHIKVIRKHERDI